MVMIMIKMITYVPIDETLVGIDTDAKAVHLEKARELIVVTEPAISTTFAQQLIAPCVVHCKQHPF